MCHAPPRGSVWVIRDSVLLSRKLWNAMRSNECHSIFYNNLFYRKSIPLTTENAVDMKIRDSHNGRVGKCETGKCSTI